MRWTASKARIRKFYYKTDFPRRPQTQNEKFVLERSNLPIVEKDADGNLHIAQDDIEPLMIERLDNSGIEAIFM